ncbi:MAG: hypothetical protein ACJASF_001972 [Vicingaceae bacterium]|jgi:hypothetical protein
MFVLPELVELITLGKEGKKYLNATLRAIATKSYMLGCDLGNLIF